jgi:hypothetical protein
LNNSGDGVFLINNLEEIIDQMDYSTSTQGLSWVRQIDSGYILSNPSLLESNQIIVDPSPIPSISPSPTPIVSPVTSPSPSPIISDLKGKLKLIKLMSCPENSYEWFELENISEDDLVGELFLSDSQGNKFEFELSLPSQKSSRHYLDRHILNNSGDTLTIVQKPNISLFSYDIPACEEKNLEFILNNNQLSQNIRSNIVEGDFEVNYNQVKVLGVTSDNLQTKEILQTEEIKQFQVPFSYISKINLLSSKDIRQQASSEANINSNLEEDTDNSFLHSVIFIISGGIILSFLGIMYFYGKDWFKNNTMA